MMTRDEFEKLAREMMEAEHLRRVAIVSGFDTVEFFSGEVAAKQAALLAAYDAMAARIAELEAERDAARAEAQARLESYNSEADEFNAGFDAYRAGLSPDDEPEVAHDVWRVGYAWAAYDTHIARIAELEAACERALEGLRAPTHAANDHNCEDWPPGQGCRGCDGNELRKAVASEIAALLRGER